MNTYFIGFDLPSPVRHQLKRLCYGLPSVNWMDEENFQLTTRYLGPIQEEELINIQNHLPQIAFLPFEIGLKTIYCSRFSKREHWICVGIEPIQPLLNFQKRLDKELKSLALLSYERSFKSTVLLGKYETVADQRLAEYLMINSLFQSEKFELSEFGLFQVKMTTKRTYHEKIQSYTLTGHSLHDDE